MGRGADPPSVPLGAVRALYPSSEPSLSGERSGVEMLNRAVGRP